MKITPKTKLKPHPLFKGLPNRLKDPKVFKGIELRLTAILKTNHTHKDMKAYAKCEQCEVNFLRRRKLMKEIGFKNFAQYLEWKKIMGMMLEIGKIRKK